MKLTNVEQMDTNDIDIKARELLQDELRASGINNAVVVIWTDEQRAYLDNDEIEATEVYHQLAAHFNKQYAEQTGHTLTTSAYGTDREQINDALLNRYIVLVEKVEKALEEQTMQTLVLSGKAPVGTANAYSHGTDGTEMVTWRRGDGWYGCLQGQYQGNWSEGEDVGPFETREGVEAELRDQYNEDQE